jgi:cystathionine beta-lyase/cystathionine gamma-synthase
MAPAIYPSSVWSCQSTQQAERLLDGEESGYVYQRERHPNEDQLAEKLRELHGADRAIMTSSGMAAMAAAVLAILQSGSRIVASNRLYGASSTLLKSEAERFGVRCDIVDTCDLTAVARAVSEETDLLVVETVSNPTLRVADLPKLSRLAHDRGAALLVDNTFATPIHCRPIEHGADLVMESVTKMINGHSDAMLGFLCGSERLWQRIPAVVSTWGLSSPPFDCFLASRGLATLPLRMGRASESALGAARWLSEQARVRSVDYPTLANHPDAEISARVLSCGGNIVTFHLAGGRRSVDQFIAAVADRIPFAPSLGEICTTLSHPLSTSHRSVEPEDQRILGFDEGTIRLSIGVESADYINDALKVGLAAIS